MAQLIETIARKTKLQLFQRESKLQADITSQQLEGGGVANRKKECNKKP